MLHPIFLDPAEKPILFRIGSAKWGWRGGFALPTAQKARILWCPVNGSDVPLAHKWRCISWRRESINDAFVHTCGKNVEYREWNEATRDTPAVQCSLGRARNTRARAWINILARF